MHVRRPQRLQRLALCTSRSPSRNLLLAVAELPSAPSLLRPGAGIGHAVLVAHVGANRRDGSIVDAAILTVAGVATLFILRVSRPRTCPKPLPLFACE